LLKTEGQTLIGAYGSPEILNQI